LKKLINIKIPDIDTQYIVENKEKTNRKLQI
jgi:hypothetical protein